MRARGDGGLEQGVAGANSEKWGTEGSDVSWLSDLLRSEKITRLSPLRIPYCLCQRERRLFSWTSVPPNLINLYIVAESLWYQGDYTTFWFSKGVIRAIWTGWFFTAEDLPCRVFSIPGPDSLNASGASQWLPYPTSHQSTLPSEHIFAES